MARPYYQATTGDVRRWGSRYAAGETIAEIASTTPASFSCVATNIRRSGVKMRPTTWRHAYPEGVRQACMQARAEGLTYKQVAERCGVSLAYAWSACNPGTR